MRRRRRQPSPRRNARSASSSGAVRRRSGRRASVVRSVSWRRQRRTAAWSPEPRTSGTARPRNVQGLVYCGCSSTPVANESSGAEASLPSTPGRSRAIASRTTSAASSPPLKHVVADRQLFVDPPGHALVHTLVASAHEQEAGFAGERRRAGLVEAGAARRQQDATRAVLARCVLDGGHQRLRLHHHALAAAVRDVVHLQVPSAGVVAQLVQPDLASRRAHAPA